jgi:hypothetical protein
MDFFESEGNYWFWANRCVQCGDLVDELTLRNRALPRPQTVEMVEPLELIQDAMESQAIEQAA